jgi:hypothetical protein
MLTFQTTSIKGQKGTRKNQNKVQKKQARLILSSIVIDNTNAHLIFFIDILALFLHEPATLAQFSRLCGLVEKSHFWNQWAGNDPKKTNAK